MGRYTDEWVQEMIEGSIYNKNIIIKCISQYSFITYEHEHEFLYVTICGVKYNFDFGIGNSVCNLFGCNNERRFKSMDDVKDYIKSLPEFKIALRESKLKRIIK